MISQQLILKDKRKCAYSLSNSGNGTNTIHHEKLAEKVFAIKGTVETDALFITIDETPLTKRQLQNRITHYGKKASIKDVKCSCHTFRHTFAKISVNMGLEYLN